MCMRAKVDRLPEMPSERRIRACVGEVQFAYTAFLILRSLGILSRNNNFSGHLPF